MGLRYSEEIDHKQYELITGLDTTSTVIDIATDDQDIFHLLLNGKYHKVLTSNTARSFFGIDVIDAASSEALSNHGEKYYSITVCIGIRVYFLLIQLYSI